MSGFTDRARAILWKLDPERAHDLTIRALRSGLVRGDAHADDPILSTEICGLALPNPVGLAAGFDKNAAVPDAILSFGFGFTEVGTITPKPQAGNDRPRVFRLTDDRAVVNRLGFNNQGLKAATRRLTRRQGRPGIVGANVGANKTSEDRAGDYEAGVRTLYPYADYFTVNVSSPNTPGLRDLQHHAELEAVLAAVTGARAERQDMYGEKPVFLKIAPDLEAERLFEICRTVDAYGIDGMIVSNTTVSRPPTLRSALAQEPGGLSGPPLFERSTRILKAAYMLTGGRLPLIGVGGVSSGEQAYRKILAGASAVQLYTALVYEGPGLVRAIKEDLAARLRADGFSSVAEAVGREAY